MDARKKTNFGNDMDNDQNVDAGLRLLKEHPSI